MTGRDPRFEELDRLIAMKQPRAERGSLKRARLEATAVAMREKYRPKAGKSRGAARVASNPLPAAAFRLQPDPPLPQLKSWIVEGKVIRETEKPWIKRRQTYLRETGR